MWILGPTARHSAALNFRLHWQRMFKANFRRPAAAGRVLVSAVLLTASLALGSCSSVSGFVSDSWPTWAGGMPKDVPPRPGAPGYEEFLVHQQGKDVAPQPASKENAYAAPVPAANEPRGEGSAQGALY